MIKVCVGATYPELAETARAQSSYWLTQGVELEIFTVIGRKEAAAKTVAADALVSRGITGNTLHAHLDASIPFVELETSGYDVVDALHECMVHPSKPKRVAVIGTTLMLGGVSRLSRLLDVELICKLITDDFGARRCLDESIAEGADMVIGGSVVVGMAQAMGVPAAIIKSSDQSLARAIQEAVHLARVARETRLESARLSAGLDALTDGIIMADASGVITGCNKAAGFMFQSLLPDAGASAPGWPGVLKGNKLSRILGRNVSAAEPGEQETLIVLEGRGGNVQLVSTVLPVEHNGVHAGYVVTVQEVARVSERDGRIRSNIARKGFQARLHFSDCIGEGALFKSVLEQAMQFSGVSSNLLIYGETGTGKEIFAQSIHNDGPRKLAPFVPVNCAALPEPLLESELFGYAPGAFTGATKDGKIGLFELAHGGTIFLDEISEIPLSLQAKLLRVLQDKEVRRLGSNKIVPVDVRIIAASNKRLADLAAQGEFRMDLLYRLEVLHLELPPLRERREDIDAFVRFFVDSIARERGLIAPRMTIEALGLLRCHTWPGNVRELQNVCERLVVLGHGGDVGVSATQRALGLKARSGERELSPSSTACIEAWADEKNAEQGPQTLRKEAGMESATPLSLKDMRRQAVLDAMEAAGHNKTRAAALLGVSRTTLWRLLH